MSEQFMPGDLVECVHQDDFRVLHDGSHYIVEKITSSGSVRIEGVWHCSKRFRLVRRAEPETQPVKTLRDEFATAAMQGILACHGVGGGSESVPDIASAAYEMAEAMLAERSKRKEGGA